MFEALFVLFGGRHQQLCGCEIAVGLKEAW